MESVSAVLRKKIMKVMNDGIERDVSDIKQAIEELEGFKYGEDYREGHLAGSLRALKSSGQLQQLDRGVYKLPQALPEIQEVESMMESDENREETAFLSLVQVKREVISNLCQQYQYLLRYMDGVALSSLVSTEDFENAKFLLDLKNDIRNLLKKNHVSL